MFDLERAITDLMNELRRKQALQDGDRAELESHFRDKIEDLVKRGAGEEDAFRSAVEEFRRAEELDGDYYRARTTRRNGRPPWKRPKFMPDLAWHYLKVVLRKSRRQKLFVGINIGGLALGLAVCLLAFFWIENETGFDRFHERLNDIAQVYCEMSFADGNRQTWTGSFFPLSAELKANSPEVLEAARFQVETGISIRNGEKVFTNDAVALADPSFFNIFSFPFVQGDPRTAFEGGLATVISEKMAAKYFGTENPLGKTLQVHGEFDLTVTGIIRDVPLRSTLQFDCVIPFAAQFAPTFREPKHWGGNPFQTYVLLRPGIDRIGAAATMSRYLAGHFDKTKLTVGFQLLPFSRKHLFEPDAALAPMLRLFALIAAFILLIACINYVNLSTARGLSRAKEIGIRKSVGGRKIDLLKQFLGESLIFSLAAAALAVGLTLLLLPAFNRVMGSSLQASRIGNPGILLSVLALAVFTAMAAGAYPAFVLARLEPREALRAKSAAGPGGSGILRKALIVVQFALAAVMVVGMIILDRQLVFIKNADLGYDRHNLISLPLSPTLSNKYEAFRTELLRDPAILSVTASAQNPINIGSSVSAVDWEGRDPARTIVLNFDWVGFDYFETLGVPIVQGRSFSREFQTDLQSGYIVNETAVRMMGLENPIGRRLSVFEKEGLIVGVAKDFHYRPLRSPVGPFVFFLDPGRNSNCFIRVRPGASAGAVARLQSVIRTLAPGEPFDFGTLFLDDQMLRRSYPYEERIRSGSNLASLLAILIACAGLFGLAAFLTEQRTKEIGMRKILGASGSQIALELSREFALLVVLADLLALPAAYFLGQKLFSQYAYHVPLLWSYFALAGVASLLIAGLTVASLTVRAANRNPVQSLRYE